MDVDKLGQITVSCLIDISKWHMQLLHLDCQLRARLYSAISCQNADIQVLINEDISKAIACGLRKYGKRRFEGEGNERPSARARLDQNDDKTGIVKCEFRINVDMSEY